MTESPSADPFADLFGKLPDPRSRDLRMSGEDAGRGTAGGPATGSAATDGAPVSRRAAREAARQSTGSTPVTDGAAAPEAPPVSSAGASAAAAPAQAASASAAAQHGTSEPVAPYGPGATAVRADTAPVAPPIVDLDAEAAPAYSRTGSSTSFDDILGRRDESTPRASSQPAAPATLDALFTGSVSTDEIGAPPPKKDKRRRRIGGWIALGVILLLLGGAAGGAWYAWTTYEDKIREVMGWEEPKDYEAGMANGEVYVTIAPGDTGMPISESLYAAGVTKTDDAFYDYLIENGENPPFVPGVFKLQKQMTSEAALAALLDPANKMENTAQLREGLTVDQSLPLLAEGTGIPIEEFQAAVADPSVYGVTPDPAVVAAGGQPLEGWLFPATYTFNPDVTPQQVIQTLVDRTVQSLDEAGVPVEDRQRVLNVASIIQREARYEADMQKVATVIENRMDPSNQETFGLLQMDSTAQYGYGEMHDGTVSSSGEALADPNPWNTYVNAGLPVGPISNPGDAAIAAVMNPSGGDWMYFVTVNLDTGETLFTTNLNDHNRAVAQWQDWCSQHPDSGC
ncbi:endolytic transglycosylase MltG [Microbacterium sp. Root166]|uniref:endolytic transglycosylase MltG n=1 Tax=Microbacterium sp. Root166 TaxID=1736478 RepID=UPI0009EAD426|nr:endolytic transglycosylase MltG [Microbacterium sp. Root166]